MITTKRLNEETFAPFGRAILMPSGHATAADVTFAFWSDVAHYAVDGETEIGYCTVYRQQEDSVDWMERHDHTPEFLVPVDAPFILPVMTEDGRVEAFHVDIGQAVVIDRGAWHSACKPAGADSATYFVVFRRGTPQEDVIKKDIEPVRIARE